MIDLEKPKQEIIKSLVENSEKTENAPVFVEENQEIFEKEISKVDQEINKQKEIILDVEYKVGDIRKNLGLHGDVEIPSIENNKNKIFSLEEKKILLEKKLKEVLSHDVSKNYENAINEVKKTKIDWANSSELVRRLKLKGATDEDVEQIKNWLINNTNEAKTVILPPEKFSEAVEILKEMTQQGDLEQASGFHIPGEAKNVPEEIQSSIFLKEKNTPSLLGYKQSEKKIDTEILHHEMGHVAQDGLLNSELYNDFNPKFKETAQDKEYIGNINETDTRIRAMFRNLGSDFNPEKEVFGKKQLQILREKLERRELTQDVKDLLDHYDDITLVKMANRLPAI